ncbi:MAG: cysteine--tRNA ligase [bacterium]|nr:cysteine--tRNA ligase [bacterium]
MIKLYDTLSRKKQIFRPLSNKAVKIYACGPTVYDFAHIGNLRTYIFEDILRRTLEYNGYKIKQVMNITDVEDKIIKKAKAEKKDIFEITKPYTKIFFGDLKKLNIEKSEFYPKATEHIKEMVCLIKKLIAKGFAYRGEDGSIYFSISKFRNYGELSRLKKRELKIGVRIEADEYNKNQAQDFVLWKMAKVGEPSWPSPWGWGRPGWHIECSAMSMKYLGETLDIHTGAVDLIFPHHENEIAQSEAATGKKFVKYWLHSEHLLVNNQKMSKSLGNIFTLHDIERKSFNPLAFRYLILTTHYRSKLNFTWESLEAAQNALNKLYKIASASPRNDRAENEKRKKFYSYEVQLCKRTSDIQKYENQFLAAINDDLNMPKALVVVWQIVKDDNLVPSAKKRLLLKFDNVLGLELNKIKPLKIPQKIKRLAAQREKLRINKQFIQADALRKKIEELGYEIEDAPQGPKVLRN